MASTGHLSALKCPVDAMHHKFYLFISEWTSARFTPFVSILTCYATHVIQFRTHELCGPIADLVNLMLLKSNVLAQWKSAYIQAVPRH